MPKGYHSTPGPYTPIIQGDTIYLEALRGPVKQQPPFLHWPEGDPDVEVVAAISVKSDVNEERANAVLLAASHEMRDALHVALKFVEIVMPGAGAIAEQRKHALQVIRDALRSATYELDEITPTGDPTLYRLVEWMRDQSLPHGHDAQSLEDVLDELGSHMNEVRRKIRVTLAMLDALERVKAWHKEHSPAGIVDGGVDSLHLPEEVDEAIEAAREMFTTDGENDDDEPKA